MISRLSGKLLETSDGTVLLDVGGVGYEVEVSTSVLTALPATGEPLIVHTHFVVRDDAQLLFGFSSKSERELFRAFIKINGVGPKLGLAIISALDVDALRFIVKTDDPSLLTKVPGIGKTTAQRIMVELKNRFDALIDTPETELIVVKGGNTEELDEAQGALIGLGYRPQEAQLAIKTALAQDPGANLDAAELIRRALRTFDKAAG